MSNLIELNSAGMRELLLSADVEAGLMEIGQHVAATFTQIAPVGVDPDTHPGQYRDSVVVYPVRHKTRVVVRVGSDVDYALYLEARYRVLGRALDGATGLRSKGTSASFLADKSTAFKQHRAIQLAHAKARSAATRAAKKASGG